VAAGCGGQGVVAPTPVTVVGTVKQAAPVAKGDPAAGKTLFASNGCSGCHTYKPAGATGKVGPDLDNLMADAQKANQGPLDQYTATSIKSPDSYVVPGFQAGVMPSFSSLSDQQVADLVAFLTQKS
jgi:cytochrome c1